MNSLNLSQKQKSASMQDNPLVIFKVDQKVSLKKEFEQVNGGRALRGYVNSIRLDRNGVWYEVIFKKGKSFTSKFFLDTFLESP